MKRSPNSDSGIFNRRTLVALVLVATGFTLGLASFATTGQDAVSGRAISSGARIYVTTTAQKIGGIGTGGCSLQEAIYSAVLHDSLDGGAHGIAIDSTDPDHFITTECVMGTGNGDTIILPVGAVFELISALDDPSSPLGVDAHNYIGPTATPIIFSTMTIEAAGATLEWKGSGNSRLFTIGQATVKTPNGTASGTGGLTIRNADIKGFHVKGGDGRGGGGGGMGAGGAIYLQNGTLVVENSTFESNGATGGNGGGGDDGGGGGGLNGSGGHGGCGNFGCSGGGGGGSGGDGAKPSYGGGGGGGTLFSGTSQGVSGGYLCGGDGGIENDGKNASCAGGGGGGGGFIADINPYTTFNGGNGSYGGGGGGGNNNGGSGGFGGGGGASALSCVIGPCAGNGGFGGGGGDGGGSGGPFGGHSSNGGGGGGALGGAIFNDSGAVTVHNSTFYNNFVARGLGLVSAGNGGDAGGAIFSRDGDLTIVNSTFTGNQSTGSGGGVVIYNDNPTGRGQPDIYIVLTLDDTIIASNGANECFFTGNVRTFGVGNLIMSNGSGAQPFGSCPGVVTNVDPQLGLLQDNGGMFRTRTMAIPLFSSAMGVADPATSFQFDQRYDDRPQPDRAPRTGYDIGAYEVCRMFQGPSLVAAPCRISLPPPPTTTLTMQVSPAGEGTTNPPPGQNTEDQNSVVPITATANSGYHFVNWTGNVADPNSASTTVVMSQPQTVTANFVAGTPTPSPTPIPTPTPSSTPCRFRCGPTPTPTPPSSPTPTPPHRGPIPNAD